MENSEKNAIFDADRKELSLKNISTSKEKSTRLLNDQEFSIVKREANDNRIYNISRKNRILKLRPENDDETKISRVQNIFTLTNETLARVERLNNSGGTRSTRDLSQTNSTSVSSKSSSGPSSLERKRSVINEKCLGHSSDDSPYLQTCIPASILKYKALNDTSSCTAQLSFSHKNKKSNSIKKQGILKKRKSLDESLVLRRRSTSEVENIFESKSILKGQISSLEELNADQSQETETQGILKRKNLMFRPDTPNSPQGILKRPSVGDIPEVSITNAAKITASSGIEKFVELENVQVKPILKKKSNSEDQTFSDNFHSDVPKPILKKYLSSENNYYSDEQPRPILKMSKGIELDNEKYNKIQLEFRPILKENKGELSRSFLSDELSNIQKIFENRQEDLRSYSNVASDVSSIESKSVDNERHASYRHKHISTTKFDDLEESIHTSLDDGARQDVAYVKSKTDSARNYCKITKTQLEGDMSYNIAKLQATLQMKGESGWKKRYEEKNSVDDELKLLKGINKYNAALSEKTSILSSKKDELDAASKRWKFRVEKSDAENFTVSGKMEKSVIRMNIDVSNTSMGAPLPKRFIGKKNFLSASSTEKNETSTLKRSKSNPDPSYLASHLKELTPKITTKTVVLFNPSDIIYTEFYKNLETHKNQDDQLELNLKDFDVVERTSLLAQRRDIQMQNRKKPTRNPIKALAVREDIKHEYTEVLTGVAEREIKRLNIEKLAKSSSNFDIQALAGLASREDFKSVRLKKNTCSSILRPYKDLMLIQVKGRRHVQLRLVEPVATSLNEGDCFILVSPKAIYNFIGVYSNIIEQAKAADIANYIQKTNDLGVKTSKVITINTKSNSSMSTEVRSFWKLINSREMKTITDAGNPSEDEIYESNILLTNMVYSLENNELVPIEEYWGSIPKYELLSSTALLVFDFGTEMYVWSGKNAVTSKKQHLLDLAKELWDEGYDYSNCNICPLTVASLLGERNSDQLPKKSSRRPDWALFAKITQHAETTLFKEKFLDWPDLSRIIQVKSCSNTKQTVASYDIKPVDVNEMFNDNCISPDLIVEGIHLGRGDSYFDKEKNILHEVHTVQITVWKILENTYEILNKKQFGQFYEENSYIVKWKFNIIVKGRELSGKPSKHNQIGRELVLFFYWQGYSSSINEKGIAALLTVELDNESAPQIRVIQGSEPPVFLQLFNGTMIVHKGKMNDPNNQNSCKLFITRGEIPKEACLLEVPSNARQLRSRSSLLLIDERHNQITIWHGCKSSLQTRKAIKQSVEGIVGSKLANFNLEEGSVMVKEIEEGDDEEFFKILGGERDAYVSLLENGLRYEFTPKMFNFQSISGNFSSSSLWCPYRSEYFTPLPFLQEQLYSASQPAIFLIDNEYELWLWQGWWPQREEEDTTTTEQTGSSFMRYQAERKAAIETAINYWKKKLEDSYDVNNMHLIWAGVEPVEFQNIFPFWEPREDIAVLNIREGKKNSEKRNLDKELAFLSRTEFSLEELLQRPLPEGVDPTRLEYYLSTEDFESLVSISKDDFQKLPLWKQTALKKESGLF